tara:strand:- start:3 stop:455 length:453 start_codon:yes stop_codon:yes gene_type:complete
MSEPWLEIGYNMNDYYLEKEIDNLLRRFNMTKMPYISKLAEEGNLEELTAELGNTKVAQGFIDAHKEMRLQKDNPAFKKLNEIHDNMIHEEEEKMIKEAETNLEIVQEIEDEHKSIKGSRDGYWEPKKSKKKIKPKRQSMISCIGYRGED